MGRTIGMIIASASLDTRRPKIRGRASKTVDLREPGREQDPMALL